MSHLLIVDDEESICWGLRAIADGLGCTVSVAASAEQAYDAAAREQIDLAIVDVRLPGMDGLSLLRRFRDKGSDFPCIVITAYGDLDTAVDAIQCGAFDYIAKPFDVQTIESVISSALATRGTQANDDMSCAAPASNLHPPIVGTSPAIQEVFKQIAMVAPTTTSVHLFGESGTGKELIARAIHQYSQRHEGPFVVVHAAAINEELAESELFGHVRGSFTGAEQSRVGLLQQADGGTLFLDEVGDIPIRLQTKLLRAIEYGEVVPVGSNRPMRCDFRVISATHRDLRACIAAGTFREDLYFRLLSYQISIPPLRERRQDVAALARYFVAVMSERSGLGPSTLGTDALKELESRFWQGNVRELRNAIEHALIAARGQVLRPEHIPAPPTMTAPVVDELEAIVRSWIQRNLVTDPNMSDLRRRLVELVERPLFRELLHRHRGNVASAARQLGLHRVTLKRKLDSYNER